MRLASSTCPLRRCGSPTSTPRSTPARSHWWPIRKSPLVKLHYPIRHPPTMTMEEAQTYWRTMHGPLVRSSSGAGGILRYIQVHRYESPAEAALRESRGTEVEPYTGHAEAWSDRSVPRAGPEAKAAGRAAFADEANFIDFARSTFWVGKDTC